MGIDAWGWGGRLNGRHRTHLQAAGAAFLGLRRANIAYSQIERLINLGVCRSRASRWRASPSRSPAPGGTDPRVVAILDDAFEEA